MRHMKKRKNVLLVIGAVLVIMIIGITLIRQSEREWSFEEGFYELQKIDEKHNTSYHTEMLNETMVPLEEIPKLIEDITAFEKSLSKRSNSVEVKALFIFTDIRKLMLTSQWYFQLGEQLGDTGLVNDATGFSCNEAEDIINTAFYYNESFVYGLQAEEEIDDMLYMYKYHPRLWDLVGVDTSKARFFASDLRHIRHIPINNLQSLEVYCDITGIKHETTYLPFVYEREFVPKEVFA